MHVHILGICGTFMGGLAILARNLGHRVTGSDANVYPPMSTQLESQGIELMEGYDPAHLQPYPDVVIVGNAMSRGNPAVEYVLNQGIKYTSGPQWLSEHVLQDRWVLACAGTHGKTSTTSMLAWILEYAGMSPGFLIGGVPSDFGCSASLGDSVFFVIEADEYDTAFFDKRSKFVHYRPRTVVLNNLEFDHADIFADLAAIQTQFHHLLRTVPENGLVILPQDHDNLEAVLDKGCWTPVERIAIGANNHPADLQAELITPQGDQYKVLRKKGGAMEAVAEVKWTHIGEHNVANGLAAIAAAKNVGVTESVAAEALSCFKGVKRRMELLATVNDVAVYDDFAHHPTAITTTLAGLRAKVGEQRILAIIEPRSNTMRMGMHRQQLAQSASEADAVFWYQPEGLDWDLASVVADAADQQVFATIPAIIKTVCDWVAAGDHVVIMSNGGFGGIHQQLIQELSA